MKLLSYKNPALRICSIVDWLNSHAGARIPTGRFPIALVRYSIDCVSNCSSFAASFTCVKFSCIQPWTPISCRLRCKISWIICGCSAALIAGI